MSRQAAAAFFALAVAIGALVWVFQPKPVVPPRIVDLVALDASGKPARALSGTSTLSLSPDEALDFRLEVPERQHVYVFRAVGDRATLEWGPGLSAIPMEQGTWAPEWSDERVTGLRFQSGSAELIILASPKPLGEVHAWSVPELRQPRKRCPLCSTVSLQLSVGAQAGK